MLRPLESINLIDINNAEQIRDGDELRNVNSFEFLLNIADKIILNNKELPFIKTPGLCAPPIQSEDFTYENALYHALTDLKTLFSQHKKDKNNNYIYESRIAYGNFYTSFLNALSILLPIFNLEREKMLEQCKTYTINIQKIRVVLGSLDKKIKQLEDDIDYYYSKPEQIKWDPRYNVPTVSEIENALLSSLKRREKLKENIYCEEQAILLIHEFLNNFDQVIDKIYFNPNQGLERSTHMIKDVIKGVCQTSKRIEQVICERLKGNSTTKSGKLWDSINFYTSLRDVNKITPQGEGSLIKRGIGLVSPSFKPLKMTSMPSIREYTYKKGIVPLFAEDNFQLTEIRMGTQAEYHRGDARVSPIFDFWLTLQERKREQKGPKVGQTRIGHIYFNFLSLDENSFEGRREAALSRQLHQLEESHNNVAVITLPANRGLMNHHFLEHHEKTMKKDAAFVTMRKIATENSKEHGFHLSDAIKKLLYGGDPYDLEKEVTQIQMLLNKSFETLGFSACEELSEAELQAVYFHFIKFELVDFILDRLQPDSFNMSCKDGIDRAGISSAYYNLMKSTKSDSPFTEAEFIRALHGAPTMVKGRGMNDHSKIIWNTVDAYINANLNQVTNEFAWLIDWRNQNAPPHTRPHYINELTAYIEKNEQLKLIQMDRLSFFYNNKNVAVNENCISTAKEMLSLLTDPYLAEKNPQVMTWDLTDKELFKVYKEIDNDHLFDPLMKRVTENVKTPTVATY